MLPSQEFFWHEKKWWIQLYTPWKMNILNPPVLEADRSDMFRWFPFSNRWCSACLAINFPGCLLIFLAILSSDVLVYHRDGGETSPFWSNRSTELSWLIKRLESQLRGSDPFGETPQRQNRWLKAPNMYFCCRSNRWSFFWGGVDFCWLSSTTPFFFFWKEDWENLLSLIIWLFLCGRLEHIMDMFSQKNTLAMSKADFNDINGEETHVIQTFFQKRFKT